MVPTIIKVKPTHNAVFNMWNYLKIFSFKKLFSSLLQAFGILWLIVEITQYFFGEHDWIAYFKEKWWAFLAVGLLIGIYRAWPRLSMCYRILGTDVDIEVKVRDIFKSKAAMIVGCNTTFDVSVEQGMVAGQSIQGQFINNYYDSESDLEEQIQTALTSLAPAGTRDATEKTFGNLDEYENGTTIGVNATSRRVYLVVISRLNTHKAAEANDNSFLDALPRMWFEIRSKGGMENLDCPILGSGFSRLKMNRQELIFELIRSFIAATRDGKVTEKITFHISRNDYVNGHVDFEKVRRLLEHECSRLPASYGGNAAVGTEV